MLKRLVLFSILLFILGCKKEAKNFYLVNILNKELFDDAHIKGSINIPFSELTTKASNWNKNAKIILYCSNYMCLASGEGARQLNKLGFTNVYAYEAGMAEWYQEGLPTVGPCKKPYLKVKVEESEKSHDIVDISTKDLKDLLINEKILK